MKKRLLLTIMSLTMLLSLTACGSKEEVAVAEPAFEVAVEEPASEQPVPVESTEQVTEETSNKDEIIQWTNDEIKKEVQRCLNKEETDTVTVAEAASIVDYDISLNENFDTTDIKYLTGVEKLSINGDKITDISFIKSLPNVTILNIYSENLTDLSPLKDNKSIESLSIRTYGLEDLYGLSGMTSLKYLGVNTDALSDISTMSEFISLETCWITSYNLESVTGDFSKLTNLYEVSIGSDVLTDATALSTVPFVLGEDQCIYFSDCLLSETTISKLADWTYEKWCLECKTNGEEKHYQSADNYYNTGLVDFNNNQASDLYDLYLEQLITEKGHPRDLIPVAEKPQPVNNLQENFDKMEFELDGQLISLPCSLQTLLDYGYVVADDTDITDKLSPRSEEDFIELSKPNSNINIIVEVINQDEKLAKELSECSVYYFKYDASEIEIEERPEFYIIKCKREHPERGECSESGYISWDSDAECLESSLYMPYYGNLGCYWYNREINDGIKCDIKLRGNITINSIEISLEL